MRAKAFWLQLGLSAALVTSACSHSAKVSDEGFARVPAADLKDVNDLRVREAQATDEMGRRELAIQAAKNEVAAAEPEAEAADSLVEQAKAALKQAEYDRDVAGAQRARQSQSTSLARQQAASAWVQAAKSQVELAEARQQATEAERELIRSQIEIAKFDALVRTGDPEAQKAKGSELYSRKEKAQKRLEAAQREEAELTEKLEQARLTLRKNRDYYQSTQGTGGSGAQ